MRIGQLHLSASVFFLAGVVAAFLPVGAATAQEQAAATPPKKILTAEEKLEADIKKGRSRAKASEALFASAAPLEITLTANMRRLRGDKADQATWRPAVVSYTDSAGKAISIPLLVRTRGIWRLNNCAFPPLRLNFQGESTKGTLLQGLDKPKLVNHCRDSDQYEQYILQEMQLYRVYSLLTPASHKVKLLRVAYTDSASGNVIATRSAFLVEDPDIMAARAGGEIIETKGALAHDLEPFHNALVGVFQYFVGNTDYSINGLHNIELVQKSPVEIVPIAFDFDFSGAVNAPYATVDPRLSVRRVRDRLFRGFCQPSSDYEKVFARFNERKADIYRLYDDSIGKMMSPKIVVETLKYFDDFYTTINDPKKAKSEIVDRCLKGG